VLEAIGGARRDPDERAGLADVAGQRQMLDELALLLGGPAGVPLAGGGDVEVGDLGRRDDVGVVGDDFQLRGHW
jgi:hypothetical protein